jgi:hypothetical protein
MLVETKNMEPDDPSDLLSPNTKARNNYLSLVSKIEQIYVDEVEDWASEASFDSSRNI